MPPSHTNPYLAIMGLSLHLLRLDTPYRYFQPDQVKTSQVIVLGLFGELPVDEQIAELTWESFSVLPGMGDWKLISRISAASEYNNECNILHIVAFPAKTSLTEVFSPHI